MPTPEVGRAIMHNVIVSVIILLANPLLILALPASNEFEGKHDVIRAREAQLDVAALNIDYALATGDTRKREAQLDVAALNADYALATGDTRKREA